MFIKINALKGRTNKNGDLFTTVKVGDVECLMTFNNVKNLPKGVVGAYTKDTEDGEPIIQVGEDFTTKKGEVIPGTSWLTFGGWKFETDDERMERIMRLAGEHKVAIQLF